MTYATDLGYKVGDRFKFKEDCEDRYVDWLVANSFVKHKKRVVTLLVDDGTRTPYFLDDGNPVRFSAPVTLMDKIVNESLSQHLVSKLFELGNEGDKLTNRVSFMVGHMELTKSVLVE
jgi:hypothetical protein